MKLVLVSMFTSLAIACHVATHAKTAFDVHQFPSGDGWYCYGVQMSNHTTQTDCQRSESECVAGRHEHEVASACEHVAQAFCYAVRESDEPPQACFTTLDECRTSADAMAYAHVPSECGPIL